MRRIKFYSVHDWSAGANLQKIETFFDSWDQKITDLDVNTALELYNIKKYFDSDMKLDQWSEEQIAEYKEKNKLIPGILGRFCSTVSDTGLGLLYKGVAWNYTDDFWGLICEYKAYRNINPDAVRELLENDENVVWDILHHKALVKEYGRVISDHLRSNDLTAEKLIDCYLASHDNQEAHLYFPEEFDQGMRDEVLAADIEREDGNINSMLLLEQAQSSKEFPVSDRLRLKARKKKERLLERLAANGVSMSYGAKVSFRSIPDMVREDSFRDNTAVSEYSREWIEENQDKPTLLNNFIFLFDYADFCCRCSLISLKSDLSPLERALGVKGKKDYLTGAVFDVKQMRSVLQMEAYTEELRRIGIRIEDLFQWFFEEYLKDEFGAQGFTYTPPSMETSYAEKCKLIGSAIDGVLKQYRLFCEDGYVNRELLEMSSGHIVFGQLGSMRGNKYAYAMSGDLAREMYLLFSDQSMMTYIKKTEEKYKTLPELLLRENITKEDFELYQIHDLEWLLQRGAIILDEDGQLYINRIRSGILKDLYYNEVICPAYYSENMRKQVESFVLSGEMEYENTLFSKPEQNYLNYVLNKSEFSNGLDLRNKYSHDTCPLDERIQHQDYIELLKVFVLIIIKINEEFCMRDS